MIVYMLVIISEIISISGNFPSKTNLFSPFTNTVSYSVTKNAEQESCCVHLAKETQGNLKVWR